MIEERLSTNFSVLHWKWAWQVQQLYMASTKGTTIDVKCTVILNLRLHAA